MKKIDNSTMGGRIKDQRLKMGMTQEELAEKMFTTKMTISHYENNLTDIKGSVIVELADLLGTTTGYLLNNEVDAKTSSGGDVGNDEIIPKSYIYSNEEYSIGTVKSVSEISRKL